MRTLYIERTAAEATAKRHVLRRAGNMADHTCSPLAAVQSLPFDRIVVARGALSLAAKSGRERVERWFDESIRVRLSGPEAEIVHNDGRT